MVVPEKTATLALANSAVSWPFMARPAGLEPETYEFEVQEIGYLPIVTGIYPGSSLMIISKGCLNFACHRLIGDDTAVSHQCGHLKTPLWTLRIAYG
jgi:hypothetical protein